MTVVENEYCRVTNDNAPSYRRSLPAEDAVAATGELFRVLGSPTRVRILSVLKEQPLCVSCLSTVLEMEQSAVSQQLKVLRHNRLVKSRRVGKLSVYSLDDQHVDGLIRLALDHVRERNSV